MRSDVLWPLLGLVDVLVLAAALGAVPVLLSPAPRSVAPPTATEGVATLDRTWASARSATGAFVRLPGVQTSDDCGIGRASGPPVPDDGRRLVRWVSAPVGPGAPALLTRVRQALVQAGHAPRPSSGRGEALADADGYVWLLRTDGPRAEVVGSTPCLRASPDAASPG